MVPKAGRMAVAPLLVFCRRRVAKALTVFISTSCGSKPVAGNRRFVGTFRLGVVCELARNEATCVAHPRKP